MLQKNIALQIKNLNVKSNCSNHYNILQNVNLEITKGEMVAIIGPNGGGKSTILKSIMDDIDHDLKKEGQIIHSVSESKIAYIFNCDITDHTFPITIMDFLLSGSFSNNKYFEGNITQELQKKIKNVLLEISISENLINKPLSSLSSGELQRLCFARAILKEPEILIMDEPFSNVDHPHVSKLLSFLKNMCKKGLTVIIVVHDYYSLHNYFDRAILVASKILAQGEVHKIVDYKKFCIICNSYKSNSSK